MPKFVVKGRNRKSVVVMIVIHAFVLPLSSKSPVSCQGVTFVVIIIMYDTVHVGSVTSDATAWLFSKYGSVCGDSARHTARPQRTANEYQKTRCRVQSCGEGGGGFFKLVLFVVVVMVRFVCLLACLLCFFVKVCKTTQHTTRGQQTQNKSTPLEFFLSANNE